MVSDQTNTQNLSTLVVKHADIWESLINIWNH